MAETGRLLMPAASLQYKVTSRSTWAMAQNQDLCEGGGNNIPNKIKGQQQQQNSLAYTKTWGGRGVGEAASICLTKQTSNNKIH